MSLPQSVLDEPSAGCCELEYGYKNAFGAWEVYGASPTRDSCFGGDFGRRFPFVWDSPQ